ncbi:Peptidoglycan-binding domain 1 protein [Thalassoporum mexicanum PCC 7367]|uniref:peptidoglycan-binding domain-containing protein n=1 Tax=Thalassoporum mexicanum TaxID=3457544 RepID=UPI00029FAB12|nr:peptidoglycan-binding protein [Pseudanabaena sp. PCC 7367]AFY71808.1 Peptidoglycan-binding domain 1 protein [Pseudanabaena sp. PCC 7367]
MADPTLFQGATGPAVRTLQELLRNRRFFLSSINGIFDQSTLESVTLFQQSRGMRGDGVVGPSTWSALRTGNTATPTPTPRPQPSPVPGFEPILSRGASGPAVTELQRLLLARGFYRSTIDGEFGFGTEASVMRFQSSRRDLTNNGIVDANTWSALRSNIGNQTRPIDLVNVCRYYDPIRFPHQTNAIQWLERQLDPSVLDGFARRWRNQR